MNNPMYPSISTVPNPQLNPRQAAALNAIETQKRVTPFPYYSKVRFAVDAAEARPGPFTYTFPLGQTRRAFSYGKGELGTAAGFAGVTMTAADTNLSQGNETISGENVAVEGIAIQVVHGTYDSYFSDGRLLAQLQGNVSVDLAMNGDQNRHHLGILSMMPGGGGVKGPGIDQLGTQNLEGGRPDMNFMANGWETRSNFFRLPDGLVWRSKGHADSMMNVIFTTERQMVLYSGGDVYNPAADEAAAALIRGYLYPLTLKVELMVFLVGRVVGPRTRVA